MDRSKLEPWQKRQFRRARKAALRNRHATLSINAIRSALYGQARNERSGAELLAASQAQQWGFGQQSLSGLANRR